MLTLFLDGYILNKNTAALLVAQYFCPLMLAFFNLYLHPQLLLICTDMELNERKSVKENSFLSKVNNMLLFNLILGPYLAQIISTWILNNDDTL